MARVAWTKAAAGMKEMAAIWMHGWQRVCVAPKRGHKKLNRKLVCSVLMMSLSGFWFLSNIEFLE